MTEEQAENQQEGAGPEMDPTAMMIQFYDTWAKTWSKSMSEAVSSQTFAESMSQQMESNLDAAKMMRRQVNEMMEAYLAQVSLPSRKEVLSLSERLTRIEMEVDDLGARMDETLDLVKAIHHLLDLGGESE